MRVAVRQKGHIVLVDFGLNPHAGEVDDVEEGHAFLHVLTFADVFLDHVAGARRADGEMRFVLP